MRKVKEQTQVAYSVKNRKLYDVVNEIKNNGKVAGLIVNQLVNGDCLDVLSSYPDNAIDLTVFSPPYDGIKYASSATPSSPHIRQ